MLNKDQARRMAEELLSDCVWFPTLDKGMLVRVSDARDAFAAALAKLTQGQERKLFGTFVERSDGSTEFRCAGVPHTPTALTYAVTSLYTHPIHSQQEERVRELESAISSALKWCPENGQAMRILDAARSKEQGK